MKTTTGLLALFWAHGREVSLHLTSKNRAALLRALARGEIECEELLRLCRVTLIQLELLADDEKSTVNHQRVQLALLGNLLEGAVAENPSLLKPLEE